jgi:hypothetical protein
MSNEPTFYLNDLAGESNVDVSGITKTTTIDAKPDTTFSSHGIITNVSANDAQKWFQFNSGNSSNNNRLRVDVKPACVQSVVT